MAPLLTGCGRHDLYGESCDASSIDKDNPRIYLFDVSGGIDVAQAVDNNNNGNGGDNNLTKVGSGIAVDLYNRIEDLWEIAKEVIEKCPCVNGCPLCIHRTDCGEYNQGLDKALGLKLLKCLLNEI